MFLNSRQQEVNLKHYMWLHAPVRDIAIGFRDIAIGFREIL